MNELSILYINDILIFSKERESQYWHLATAVSRIPENKLWESPRKCEFFKGEIDFLGILIGENVVIVNQNI